MKVSSSRIASLVSIAVLTGSLLACSLSAAPVTEAASLPTIVAGTLQALTTPVAGVPTAAPAGPTSVAVPTQPSGAQVAFGNVSFVIPAGLATGASCETVPAVSAQSGGPWETAPAYTRCTLQGYPLSGKFFEPQVMVYPAQAYASVNDGAAMSLQRLQAIIGNPSASLSNDVLPRLPYANAEQAIGAAPKIVDFQDGKGVRVFAEYAQYFATINNHDLFYHFEGLTADGASYIVAVLPINASFLAASSDPNAPLPPGGIPFPGYDNTDSTVFQTYYNSVSAKLSATSPEDFQPTLTDLDSLIASLHVSQ